MLYIARGEISEVQSHLIVAYNLGHLEKQEFQFLIKEYEGLKIGLSKYIQSLAKQNTD